MAKGNIIQGQASGKLGDSVLMVRNGQQLARVYTTSGARAGKQASEAARIQRVKFGSASNQWSLYKYVCTRMFRKGRKTTQSDYNYFVKRNNQLLPYLTKQENADGVHLLQPGQFSEGNLGRIELVHTANPSATGTMPLVSISDLNAPLSSAIAFDSKMSTVKTRLAEVYPAARKITYLFSLPSEVTIEEEGISFVSQFVSHNIVVVDLYEEIVKGENTQTLKEYFVAHLDNSKLKAVFSAQGAHSFASGSSMVRLFADEGVDVSFTSSLGILMFATDDLASDCYSTILQDSSIPTSVGAYALWAGYRTQEALRVAADSYGYQSGVMRDNIASAGDELTERAYAYINKVKTIDKELAEQLEKSVKEEGVNLRSVRKITTQEEEKK